jgi:curved DNA-binding protein CbpA
MNYYRLLGINKNATRDEITRAYRKEIFKNHPDRNIGKENEKLSISILLNEAYEILTNDEKKKEYDKNINDVELKTNKLKKKLQYLNYMKNRMKEHVFKFETNYYSDLRFNTCYEILIPTEKIDSIIEKLTGIKLNDRFIGFDIETTEDYNWLFFRPADIYKRKYCITLNTFDSKLFYVLVIDKNDYDKLFKDRKTNHVALYFNGENLMCMDKILDRYIKCIVHYN